MTQENRPQQTEEHTATSSEAAHSDEATFAISPDDPRSTQSRGGLGADISGVADTPTEVSAAGEGPADLGTTGTTTSHSFEDVGATDDVGALSTGVGTANSGQLTTNTTGLWHSHSGPPGVGPTEGSASGATSPQVEMTDIGLVDVNMVDMSVTEDDDTIQGGGARVEDAEGNPL